MSTCTPFLLSLRFSKFLAIRQATPTKIDRNFPHSSFSSAKKFTPVIFKQYFGPLFFENRGITNKNTKSPHLTRQTQKLKRRI